VGSTALRAENPQFDNARPVRRREAPTNVSVQRRRAAPSAATDCWAAGTNHTVGILLAAPNAKRA